MTTEPLKPEPAATAPVVFKAPVKAGGRVLAIIPQDLEQVWRIATMAVHGGMAPDSLIKVRGEFKPINDAISSCAIAIMAGAELGLSPMAALRNYAVINGRPSLWGDGIKAVVRMSGKAAYIETGHSPTEGWCESKRSDTGEVKRVTFTLEQAKKAHLDTKTGPWKEGYGDVMMERRATNRCLNDLYADVLVGLIDQSTADEDGALEATDITPLSQITRSEPPDPPAQPEPELHNSGQPAGAENEATPVAGDPDEESLAELEAALAEATTGDEVETIFDSSDIQLSVAGNDDALARAFEIKKLAAERVNRAAAIAEGQGDLLGGE